MERAQNGDQAAFAAIYQARAGEVSRYAGVILRDIDLVEDVTAQTFLLAWKNLPTLRRRDRFDAWLFRIAHNLAINELKRRPTASLDEVPELPDSTRFASPAGMLELKAQAGALRSALLRLSEDHRLVLTLRFFHDLPHAEVARRLGKSEDAVRALQYRELKQMRQIVLADEES